MKKILFLILITLPLIVFSQSEIGSKIKWKTTITSNKELHDILFFEGIDNYYHQLVGEDLKGKHIYIIAKELWEGKITKIDTVFNTFKNNFPPIQSDTLRFKTVSKKFTQDKLKIFFRFDKFGGERFYDATNSLEYDLTPIASHLNIEIGKPFPALAYILPYEVNGLKKYCAVGNSGKDVETWGKEFGIKHYIIFEMLLK